MEKIRMINITNVNNVKQNENIETIISQWSDLEFILI